MIIVGGLNPPLRVSQMLKRYRRLSEGIINQVKSDFDRHRLTEGIDSRGDMGSQGDNASCKRGILIH